MNTKQKLLRKENFLFLSMASLLSLSLLSFLLLFSFSFSLTIFTSPPHNNNNSSIIADACKATRFPATCHASLTNSTALDLLQIIHSAIAFSSTTLKTAVSMVESILKSSAGSINRTTAARNCLEVLAGSDYRLSLTTDRALPLGRTKDAVAWMSAALLYQYDCRNALQYANDTSQTAQAMSFLDGLMELTSNALSMLAAYDLHGNDTASWGPPKTERDGFWGDSGGDGEVSSFNGGVPSGLNVDVTVCKEGGEESGSRGCYKTVQEAVNAAPDNEFGRRFVIYIEEGVYEENVVVALEKRNVVFLGDGMGKTVISGSKTVGQPGISTYNTATLGVLGDGFMASGLTIQNTAGAPTHQAVAFRSDSDLSVIENCEFLGNQDTLYAHSLRHYYKSCRIIGNMDFIFGNSAAIFHDCEILVKPRLEKPEKGEKNAVTAHGRTDPAQSTGFVFQNCLINGTEDYVRLLKMKPSVHKNFLGRPWKEFSRVVFIQCNLEALINPQGWLPWRGDFALKTLYYGEFENSGPGSDLSQRVTWSSQISKEHVAAYSVQNFIQGDEWIPKSS